MGRRKGVSVRQALSDLAVPGRNCGAIARRRAGRQMLPALMGHRSISLTGNFLNAWSIDFVTCLSKSLPTSSETCAR